MAERLGIRPIRVDVGDARGSAMITNGKMIVIDSGFLDHVERTGDDDCLWIAIAHEVGHVYWDARDDWATALGDAYLAEDAADVTAGQLAAALGRNPRTCGDALARALALYATLDGDSRHRPAADRMRILTSSYACWVKDRSFL